jgi:hypothetical protein
MMTARSEMNAAVSLAISMTSSENTIRTFATLRFVGDALEPDEISHIVKEKPTRAYRKGEIYRPGPRSPEITAKTGVWYFSTKHKIHSNDLADHINALERLVSPVADRDGRLKELHDVMEHRNLQAHATLFWHGPPGARHPAIPLGATEALRRLPADIESDFANEDC